MKDRDQQLREVLRDLLTELTDGETCDMLTEFPAQRFTTFDWILNRARSLLEGEPMSDSEKAAAVRDHCRQTICSDEGFRHPFGPLIYTSGIKFVAETCGAYWLIDLVASHQPAIRRVLDKHDLRPFQVWRLRWVPDVIDEKGTVDGVKWIIDAWSDTPEREADEAGPASVKLAEQEIVYSDFPETLSPFEFWVEGETMLLKEEH